jgi:hypothetical protein
MRRIRNEMCRCSYVAVFFDDCWPCVCTMFDHVLDDCWPLFSHIFQYKNIRIVTMSISLQKTKGFWHSQLRCCWIGILRPPRPLVRSCNARRHPSAATRSHPQLSESAKLRPISSERAPAQLVKNTVVVTIEKHRGCDHWKNTCNIPAIY